LVETILGEAWMGTVGDAASSERPFIRMAVRLGLAEDPVDVLAWI
jgi:hypothetical protein